MGIAVLYGSSRKNGNSEWLTKLFVNGFDADEIYLSDYRIEPIIDYRHAEPGPYPNDDYRKLIDRVLEQDTIVIATPIYWYGLPAQLKLFIDRWSQSLRENRTDFLANMANKRAYVIAIGDDEPHVKGQPLIQQLEYIFDFVGVNFAGHVIGKGRRPEDIEQDSKALTAIKNLRSKLKANK
ncbi:flavodoxin family protein [Salinithrix halophila]|uniref:Flavodoxin family protein n=1 Tax=Salinithrix halophila TaxID=1485204 RepID=A0ABV8JAX9_9BACL